MLALVQNRFGSTAAFPAANVRNYTISTKVIAAVSDIYPAVRETRPRFFSSFDDFPFFFVHLNDVLFAFQPLGKHFGKIFEIVRAEHYIYKRKFFYKFIGVPRLLRHTAADRDYHILIVALYPFKRADVAFRFLLGVFADTTGIENNYVRILFIIGFNKSEIF